MPLKKTRIDGIISLAFARIPIADFAKKTHSGYTVAECRVNDVPEAKIALFAQGTKHIVLISIDACHVSNAIADYTRNLINEKLSIPKSAVFISATHTHSSVRIDTGFNKSAFASRLVREIKSAAEKTVTAGQIELFSGTAPKTSMVNRRYEFPDKKMGVQTIIFNTDCEIRDDCIDASGQIRKYLEGLKINPEKFIPRKGAILSGKCDRRIHLLVFKDDKGSNIFSICRLNAHPVIVSQSRMGKVISRDFPGYAGDNLEKELGCPAIILNGAFGDVRPLNREYSYNEAERIGLEYSSSALRGKKKSITFSHLSISSLGKTIKISIEEPATVPELWKKMEDLKTLLEKEKNPYERKRLSGFLYKYDNLYYSLIKKTGYFGEDVLSSKKLFFEAAVLDFGLIRFCGVSGEPPVGFAKDVETSTNALTIGNFGDMIGYILDKEQYSKGGYEICDMLYGTKGIDDIYKTLEKLGGLI